MKTSDDNCRERTDEYCRLKNLTLRGQLGWGMDGEVYSTEARSAIKSFRRLPLYQNERDVYLRMQDRDFEEAGGFAVPKLLGFDDRLWIIEMQVVQPPFVVDFAGAYLDRVPPFSQEEWEEWERDR